MDEVTQQNSALVEENAATAKTLEHQAKAMDEQVAFFQIGEADEPTARRRPNRRPRRRQPSRRRPARREDAGRPQAEAGHPAQTSCCRQKWRAGAEDAGNAGERRQCRCRLAGVLTDEQVCRQARRRRMTIARAQCALANHFRAFGKPRVVQSWMKVPARSSLTACCSSLCAFITIGPYQATGSLIGLPDTSRKRMPCSPA